MFRLIALCCLALAFVCCVPSQAEACGFRPFRAVGRAVARPVHAMRERRAERGRARLFFRGRGCSAGFCR